MFTKKPEIGIILLHNLRFGDRPMKMLDKSKLMTLEQVRVSQNIFAYFKSIENDKMSNFQLSINTCDNIKFKTHPRSFDFLRIR